MSEHTDHEKNISSSINSLASYLHELLYSLYLLKLQLQNAPKLIKHSLKELHYCSKWINPRYFKRIWDLQINFTRKNCLITGYLHISKGEQFKTLFTLIQNLKLSSMHLNAIRRLSAAQTEISSFWGQEIGLAPGFNSRMKNSLNVYRSKQQKAPVSKDQNTNEK